MKRHYLVISGLIISVFFMACFLSGARQVAAQQIVSVEKSVYSFAQDELLVKTKKGMKSYSVKAVKGASVLREHAKSSVSTVKLPPGTDLQAAIKKLKADPNVEYVEPNYRRNSFFVPNDPNLNLQWHIDKVHAKEAWDISKGNSQIVVAVIDTGVDYGHPDLQDKLDTPYNSMINSTSTADVTDDVGHGTIVTGIVAGAMNNGIGIAGVGGNISVMPVKAGDFTGFYDSDIANGIYWAVDNGARVINMSLGGLDYSHTLEAAVNYAVARNVVVIAAAGNNNNSELMYPAAFPGVIGVAATTQIDKRAEFSNYGFYIDVSAPGVDIFSTTPRSGFFDYTTNYDKASGTSMASPIVAGLAGLVLSVSPSLSSNDVTNAIIDGTDDLGPQGWDEATGWGRVDAARTLSLLIDSVPPTVISVDPANLSSDISISKTITVKYSEDILAGSNFSGIMLRDGGSNPVEVNSSITQNTLEIKPANPLSFNMGYFLTVPGGAVQDKVYNSLQANYTVSFSTQDMDSNTLLEPNDIMQTATAIVTNQVYTGTFALAGDKDFYKLNVPGAGPINFNITPISNTQNNALVTVIDALGNVVASTTVSSNSAGGVQISEEYPLGRIFYVVFESENGTPWAGGEEYSFKVNMQQELGGYLRDTQGLTIDFSTGAYKAVITPIDIPGSAALSQLIVNPGVGGSFTAGVLPAGVYRVSAVHPGNYIAVDKIVYANGWDMDFINIDLWPGDVNGDEIINSSDIDEWGCASGTTPLSPDWNMLADINKDGSIDLADLVHIAVNFSRQKTELVQYPWTGVSGGGSGSGGPTGIILQPSNSQVTVNEVFTVSVNISNSTASQGIAAADVFLTYDPAKLELQDSSIDQGVQVSNGSVLDQYTNRLLWNDSIPGRINYGGTRLASGSNQFVPMTPFRGNSTLFTAGFKALQSGLATISIDNISSILLNNQGGEIAYSVPASVSLNVNVPAVVSGVNLDLLSYALNAGNTHQTVVTAVYSNNSTYDVTQYASYNSSNPLVATVSQDGIVTGIRQGSCVITANYGGYSTQASVTVFTPIVDSTVAIATDGSNNSLAITDATSSTSINIPKAVTYATINMATMLNPAVSGTVISDALPALNVIANTTINANPVLMAIPAGATVSVLASANWDGTFQLPTVKANNSVTVTPDDGKTASVNTVIEVGFDDVPLTFSKAVRILIPGEAGKDAGYYRNGTFTKITNVMPADNQASGDLLDEGKDGRIDIGSDLVIWTKHFTKFVTYTQTATVVGDDSGASGGDDVGGDVSVPSGGGGGGGAAPAVSPSIAPVTNIEQEITSSGGKITAPSSTVIIPKGALTAAKIITAFGIDQSWVSTPKPSGYSYASEIIEFGPSGTVFTKPVTITMKYESTKIGLNDIFPYYLNENKKVWERINGARIDRLNGTISFEVTHFSKYTVMTPDTPNTNFGDTKKHWAEHLIKEYVARGAISAVVPGKFGPDNKITRAEFCKLLIVSMNFRINDSVNPFNDISEKDWFYSWVATAANLGVVHGYNFQFKPYAYITREDMAVMIIKALDAKGKYIERDASTLKRFKDRGKVSQWAQDSVSQTIKGKIINGRSSTVLAPLDNATKAEAIAMVKKVEMLLK